MPATIIYGACFNGAGAIMQNANATRGHVGRFFVGLFGGTVDILDFISISFVVPFIATQIYPSHTFAKSLLVVIAAFAASALVRPIGGPFIGSIADRIGRKKGMYLSLVGLGIAEIITGLIPTYKQIGLFSPFFLLAIRIIQGFFVAGLIASSYSIGVESFPERFRGFLTGLTGIGGSLAHFLGSIVFLITTILFAGPSFATVGWRFMFFILGGATFAVLAFTYFVSESSTFEAAKVSRKLVRTPVRDLFERKNGMAKTTVVVMLAVMGGLGAAFVINTLPTYLSVAVHLNAKTIASIVTLASLVGIASNVLGGLLLHAFRTTRNLMRVYSILFVPLSFSLFVVAEPSMRSYTTVFMLVSLWYILGYVNNPVNNLYIQESYTTNMRVSGLGFQWNMGFFMSGLIPLVISFLLVPYGLKAYPVIITIASILVGLLYVVGAFMARETRGNIQTELERLQAEVLPETQI